VISADELLRAATDPRLSPDAYRMFVVIASRGDDWHEIEADEFRVLLDCKSDNPVYRARERLVRLGLIEWKQGGRHHANQYRYLAQVVEVNAIPRSGGGGKAPVVVGEGEDTTNPLSPPVRFPLHVKAMQAISVSSGKLEGCRGALVDYLQSRVASDRQYAYVQSVVSWIDNPNQVFQTGDGTPVPPPERVKLLAVALNEMAASDESKYHAPVGDVRNVRSKLSALAKAMDRKPPTGNARASPRSRDLAPDTQVYTPTETWRGFNG
jgi:hypothetical protein